ncbi:MAG TPA: signal peptidase I, partial [Chloroflexota bacterium]|nr:signal peptidase I [Chloroflexota bacterium]
MRLGGGLAAGLATAAFVLLALGPLTGRYSTYSVMSGSMAPAMPVGSAAVVVPQDPADIHVGDVITVTSQEPPYPTVTHRVANISPTAGGPRFKTKGDANTQPDAWDFQYSGLAGKVVLVVPLAGYALFWTSTLAFRFAIALAVGLLVAWFGLRNVWRLTSFARPARLASAAARPLLAMGMLVTWWLGAVLQPMATTMASFNGAVTSQSNTFTTATGFAPTLNTPTGNCSTDAVTVSWSAPAGGWAQSYTLYEGSSSGSLSVVETGISGTSVNDPGTNALLSLPRFYKVRAFDGTGSTGAGGPTTDSNIDSIQSSPCGIPLTVIGVSPGVDETGINPGPSGGQFGIAVSFSASVSSSTATTSTLSLQQCTDNTSSCTTPSGTNLFTNNTDISTSGGQVVAKTHLGTVLADTFWYQVTITSGSSGVEDTFGNTITSNYVYVFQTASSGSAVTPPVVVSESPCSPTSGTCPTASTGVATNSNIIVVFSGSMTQSSTDTAVCVSTGALCTGTVASLGTYAWTGAGQNTLTATPSS